jgi:aminopeptidase
MFDPRVKKLAEVLVHYSLEVQPGWKLAINTGPLAEDIALAVYEEAIKAGANTYLFCEFPAVLEIFYKYASDAQLQFISPITQMITETFDARLSIDAPANTRQLSGADPKRMAMRSKAWRPLMQTFMDRAARRELRWCTTDFPTHAAAQEADMSLADYQDFVYNAGKLNEPDPVAAWKEEGARQRRLVEWLTGRSQVKIQGRDVDLTMSIKGRTFIPCDGHENFPDGEIFTGPVEDSVNGWVRFAYPAIYAGKEVVDVELWFENGKVVKEKAAKGEELLTSLLNTDPGARFLGELGIGTNYSIPRFTKNMLFDEKLGGTIHMAVGAGYPESGSVNDSGIHWDMLCDMKDGEIRVDGEAFYKDGKPLVW